MGIFGLHCQIYTLDVKRPHFVLSVHEIFLTSHHFSEILTDILQLPISLKHRKISEGVPKSLNWIDTSRELGNRPFQIWRVNV